MNFWKRLFPAKQSEARTALVINQVGRAQPGPRNYLGFAREGYQTNPIAYQCVAKISRAVSRVPLVLYRKVNGRKVKIEEHPILKLFDNPNPLQGGEAFLEAVTAFFALSGNTYIEKFMGPGSSNEPTQLWPVRPDVVKIYAGSKGLPLKYEVGIAGGLVKTFPVDQVYGLSNLTHIKTFHPTDLWVGMAPMEAAVYSLDQHNESAKWNLAMLMNMGTPSGAFTVKQDAATNPMGTLPEPQYNRLQEQIRTQIKGSQNAGRAMVLEGGVDWKQFGHNAKDMDWLEGRSLNAREIAGVYGVPTMLVNILGDSTFANFKEARFSFYEDTVIPTLEYLLGDFHRSIIWPAWGMEYSLEPDLDHVEALNPRRAEKAEQAEKSTYLTINEKREMVGKEPRPEGDVILVGSGLQSLESLVAAEDEPAPENVPPGANSTQTSPEDEGSSNNQDPDESPDDEIDSGEKRHSQNSTRDPLGLKARDSVSRETFEQVTLMDLGVKANQVNVRTAKGKRRTWTEINRARKKFQAPMYMDLKEALDDQAAALAKELKGVPNALWDMTAINALNKGEDQLLAIYKRHMKRALKAFAQPVLEAGKAEEEFETKTLFRFNQFVEKFVDEHSAKNVTEILGTSKKIARAKIRDALKEGLQEGASEQAIVDDIVTSLKNVTESRARTIARTEIGMASSNGAIEAAKALDVPDLEKEWVSDQRPFADLRDGGVTGDKPDHVAMDGARVGVDEKFSVPPDAEMNGPHDSSAGPEQVINCQCVVIFSRASKPKG